ncbi:MAG: hypothetical protein ACOX7U_05570 [Desulfitobacteriia bacterium]|jgi:hypothetical protein
MKLDTYYHVAAWVIPLEDGLTKDIIYRILELLPPASELIPFEIHEENSSLYGFVTTEVVDQENGLESIIETLSPMVEDWIVDSSEYITTLPGGKEVYIGCDYRSIYF